MPRFLVTCEYDDDAHYLDLEVWLDYRPRRKGAAEDLTQEEVEEVFRNVVSGGELPPGWSVHAVQWGHRPGQLRGGGEEDLERFDVLVRANEVNVEPVAPGTGPRRRRSESEDE